MRIMRRNRAAGIPGIMAILLLAAGCAGTPAKVPDADGGIMPKPATPAPGAAEPSPASSELRGHITQLALSMVGVPYRYGGEQPDEGFDCSGLVFYAYRSNGQDVPRTSREQHDAARIITLEEAVEGDLLFFKDQAKLSHVAIYLGDGRFVHAPSSGGAVHVANVYSPYYQRNLVAVGRLLP